MMTTTWILVAEGSRALQQNFLGYLRKTLVNIIKPKVDGEIEADLFDIS